MRKLQAIRAVLIWMICVTMWAYTLHTRAQNRIASGSTYHTIEMQNIMPYSLWTSCVFWATCDLNPSNFSTWTVQSYGNEGATRNDGVQVTNTLRPVAATKTLQFDAVNDYVSLPTNVMISSPATISMWFKANYNTVSGTSLMLFNMSDGNTTGTTNSESFWIQVGNATSGLTNEFVSVMWQPNASSAAWSLYGYLTAVNYANVWKHVLVTCNGSAFGMYIDGEAVSLTKHATWGTAPIHNGDFGEGFNPPLRATLGAAYQITQANWFNGWIDDVRIYNRVLTADEAAALYNQTKSPTPARP